jgi:hypothetical protein
MKASAFSKGKSLLLEVGSRWGNAAPSRWLQSTRCSQPQKTALPAWGERRWSVNEIAIALPSILNSNASATVW